MPPIVKRPVIGRNMVQKRLRRQASALEIDGARGATEGIAPTCRHPKKSSNNNH
jgi:hypothetical protein